MVAAAVGIGSAVAGLASSAMSSSAAGDAAAAQTNAANQASANQMAMFKQTQANEQPYMQAGQGAVNQLGALFGTNGQAPNYSAFMNSPNYQFAFNQGQKALDASAAAKGNLYAGGYGKDLIDYGQGMASQQYNTYVNQLMGLAGVGQNAASGTGWQGLQSASQSGNDLMNGANAYGTGQINQANAWSNGLGQAVNGLGAYMGYQSANSAIPNIPSSSYMPSYTPTFNASYT